MTTITNKTNCFRCSKEFIYNIFANKGKYCSKECSKRPVRQKKFLWENATPEEGIERIKKSLYSNIKKNENGCWEWTGNLYPNGYAKMGITINGSRLLGHRASWIIHNGAIPSDKLILHRCDIRQCVAPEHLFLGSQSENSRDMHAKRRGMLGDTHVNSKINAIQAREIKILLRDKQLSHGQIAEKYNVSRANISQINLGKNWKHITIE